MITGRSPKRVCPWRVGWEPEKPCPCISSHCEVICFFLIPDQWHDDPASPKPIKQKNQLMRYWTPWRWTKISILLLKLCFHRNCDIAKGCSLHRHSEPCNKFFTSTLLWIEGPIHLSYHKTQKRLWWDWHQHNKSKDSIFLMLEKW